MAHAVCVRSVYQFMAQFDCDTLPCTKRLCAIDLAVVQCTWIFYVDRPCVSCVDTLLNVQCLHWYCVRFTLNHHLNESN